MIIIAYCPRCQADLARAPHRDGGTWCGACQMAVISIIAYGLPASVARRLLANSARWSLDGEGENWVCVCPLAALQGRPHHLWVRRADAPGGVDGVRERAAAVAHFCRPPGCPAVFGSSSQAR